jgi:hypothetical protein
MIALVTPAPKPSGTVITSSAFCEWAPAAEGSPLGGDEMYGFYTLIACVLALASACQPHQSQTEHDGEQLGRRIGRLSVSELPMLRAQGAGARVGEALAVSDTRLVVGAPYDSQNGHESGAIYVFGRSSVAAAWELYEMVVGLVAGDHFGAAVAVAPDGAIAVGAPNAYGGKGAAELIKVSGASGPNTVQRVQVKATTTLLDADAAFGTAVGIAKDGTRTIVAVGAPGQSSSGGKKGAVLLFDDNGPWSEIALKTCGTGGPTFVQRYGSSLALSQDGTILAMASSTALSPVCRFRGPTGWAAEPPLSPVDAVTALSALGERLAVGIAKQLSNSQGRVEIHRRDPSSGWALEDTVTDGVADSEFGASVALGDSGNMLIVGAPQTLSGSGNPKGKVYSYQRNSTSTPWQTSQNQTFGGSSDHDRFGTAVAAQPGGPEPFASSPKHAAHGVDAGRVVSLGDSVLIPTNRITFYCDDTRRGERFGQALALMDNQGPLVVGTTRNDDMAQRAGSAQVFEFDSSITPKGYLQRARLLPSKIGADSKAGEAVAVHTSRKIIIGGASHASAAGAAWIYEGTTTTPVSFSEKIKLASPTPKAGDRFGAAVAIGDDIAAVGAPGEGTKGLDAGRVYIFFRDSSGTWSAGPELVGSDTAAGDGFGSALVLAGKRLYVGAPDHDGAASNGGAVYVFERTAKVLTQTTKLAQLSSGVLAANDRLGAKLVGDESTVIASRGSKALQVYGANSAGGFAAQGTIGLSTSIGGLSLYLDGLLVGLPSGQKAELWTRSGSNWTLRHSFAPPTGTPHDSPGAEYGFAVALGRSHAFVAAPWSLSPPDGKPKVFAYSLNTGRHVRGDNCSTGADCLNGTCVDGYCCAASCGDCETCDCNDAAFCAGTLGVVGICQPRAVGNTGGSCQSPQLCDGQGSCTAEIAIGQPCKAGDVCALGSSERACVDGICCTDPICSGCTRCDIAGNLGSCAPTPLGSTDSQCQGTKACNGIGQCKLAHGQTCANDSECSTDHCVDGVCCDGPCDKTCESCKVAGSEGSCTAIPASTDPDGECLGTDPACGGGCDGKRQCEFPGAGTSCGLCRTCDGTGRCLGTPEDDPACGSIDCDQLDSACRDYRDLESRRCASFGRCKEPNTAGSCINYSDVQCDAGVPEKDAGPTAPDSGGGGSASDGGCVIGSSPAQLPGGMPLALLIALLAARCRRRQRSSTTTPGN